MHYHLRYNDLCEHANTGIISDIVTSRVMNKRAQIFITFKFDCRTYEASVVNSARLNSNSDRCSHFEDMRLLSPG
jgi:hypothetical protein